MRARIIFVAFGLVVASCKARAPESSQVREFEGGQAEGSQLEFILGLIGKISQQAEEIAQSEGLVLGDFQGEPDTAFALNDDPVVSEQVDPNEVEALRAKLLKMTQQLDKQNAATAAARKNLAQSLRQLADSLEKPAMQPAEVKRSLQETNVLIQRIEVLAFACEGGKVVNGRCWYLAPINTSCEKECQDRGLKDTAATRTVAGDQGTDAACAALAKKFELPFRGRLQNPNSRVCGCTECKVNCGGPAGVYHGLSAALTTCTSSGDRVFCACEPGGAGVSSKVESKID